MNRPQLYRAYDFRSAWEAVVEPWLRDMAERPWNQPPGAVLVPSRTYAQFLKSRMATAGLAAIGLSFLTPGECWKQLHARLPKARAAASREELHLLLSTAAETFPNHPTARAVAADPAPLMRALDQLAASGRPYEALAIEALSPVVRSFESRLADAGLAAAQTLDGELLAATRTGMRAWGPLLIIGFDGSHWPLWTLLQAAAAGSTAAAVVLFEPRLAGEMIDQIWIDSWEEASGEARPVSRGPDTPFTALTEAIESGTRATEADITLHIGETVREEARAAVLQALRYLADQGAERVGLIVPGPGALAREAATLLAHGGIPFHDTVGHPAPATESDRAWTLWMTLQAGPAVAPLLALGDLCPAVLEPLGVSQPDLEKRLMQAFDELMVDDRFALGAHAGLPILERLPPLSPSATIDDFLRQTLASLRTAGDRFAEPIARLERGMAGPGIRSLSVSRRAYLQWLGDVMNPQSRVADEPGRHPFARIQLVSYNQAEWQSWSHLILTGLNQGVWPPDTADAPFLGQSRVDEFNRRAVRQGSQGEGQTVIRDGRGLILGPAQRSARIHRQFYNLIEAAEHAVCVTASRRDDLAPGRPAQPGDLLIRLVAAATGSGLTDEIMTRTAAATSEWLAQASMPEAITKEADPSVLMTRTAFLARRNAGTTFGPYECALAEPPVNVNLSCTSYERAVRWPEIVWFATFLDVAPDSRATDEIPWAKARGLWVHRWIHQALNHPRVDRPPFPPLPDPSVLTSTLATASTHTWRAAEAAFSAAGVCFPEWWRRVHAEAAAMSRRIVEELKGLIDDGWTRGVSEWNLPSHTTVGLPDGSELPLHGRIDLALSKGPDGPYRVLDFKTGNAPALTPSEVANGEGLQVLLYALALPSLGLDNSDIAIVAPDTGLGPPVNAFALSREPAVTRTLNRLGQMQRTGVFGMRGNPRSDFGFVHEYPLATLPVGEFILKNKWTLTFDPEDAVP